MSQELNNVNFNEDPTSGNEGAPQVVSDAPTPRTEDLVAVIDGLRLKNHELQKAKFMALKQVEDLKSVTDVVTHQNQVTNDVAINNYKQNLDLNLADVVKKQQEALELGDMEAAVKYNLEVTDIGLKLKEINSYAQERQAAIQQAQQPQYNQPVYTPPPQVPPVLAQWAQQNPWAVPGTPYFDPQRAEVIEAWTTNQEQQLRNSGRAHEIYSPQYFQALDNFVQNTFSKNHRPLSFRPGQGNVAPAYRNNQPINPSYSNGQQRGPTVDLDPRERRMAQKMGIKLQDWQKQKLNGIHQNKIKQDDIYGRTTNQRF